MTALAQAAELENMVDYINKDIGVHITTAGRLSPLSADVIPTGIPQLDTALGIGGLPAGRITEIYGDAMTGKTALALRIVAQAQRQGNVLYIDADNALSPFLLEANGVTDKNLYLSRSGTLEMAFDICWWAAQGCRLIVIDSLPALPTAAETKTRMGDYLQTGGTTAAQCLNRMLARLHETGCALLIVNQTRIKLGASYRPRPVCGYALRHYKAVSIETKADLERDRQRIRAVIRKNKCAAPMKEAYFQPEL
jgi:recombination protein RecA